MQFQSAFGVEFDARSSGWKGRAARCFRPAAGNASSAGSAFYFIMELCEGGSVGDWLARHGGRLSLAKAAPIFLQSLEGLAHAHAKGFVHRGLKPHNRGSFLNLNPNRNLTPVLASQREIRIKITNKIKREPRVDFLHPHLSRPG